VDGLNIKLKGNLKFFKLFFYNTTLIICWICCDSVV